MLLRCAVENMQLKAWTRKKRRSSFRNCNSKYSKALVRGDSYKVIVSALWRTMLLCQLKLSHKTQHPELVVECAVRIQQRFKPPKSDSEQRSSLSNPNAGPVLCRIFSEQARWCVVHCNATMIAALDRYGYTCVDGRTAKSPVSFRTESLLARRECSKEMKQLRTIFCKEQG